MGELLQVSNSFYPSMKFTIEVGGDSINLLDLGICISNGHHHFGIFIKETVTDTLIDGSYWPMAHKLAAFNPYVHRLSQIPMNPLEFDKEKSILKDLALINNVQINVERMIHKAVTSRRLDLTTSLPRIPSSGRKSRMIRLPYLGQFSSKLSRTLRPLGFKPASLQFHDSQAPPRQ